MRITKGLVAFVLAAGVAPPPRARAADWPMWRRQASRVPVVKAELSRSLRLNWVRALPRPRPAWPKSQEKLRFDASYEPVVLGRRLFVASMARDSVIAYDTRTGKELWRFYTDAPVRFAPAAWRDRLFVASDDGCLYCLDAATGTLKWRFRGAPDGRKVLGNGRLISAWPARGAPVVVDGVVYFAAGIWPFMGTFLYAVDARSGRELWCNSHSGTIWMNQPHRGAVSFAAVAPQGYLAVAGDKLVVPCGRASPATFERKTGRLHAFRLAKDKGGFDVMVHGKLMFNGGSVFGFDKKMKEYGESAAAVIVDGAQIGVEADGELAARGLEPEAYYAYELDTWRRRKKVRKYRYELLWKAPVPFARAYFQAGSTVYGGSAGGVAAVRVPPEDRRLKIVWQAPVPGSVSSMLAADDRLFVVTERGRLICFGPDRAEPRAYERGRGAAEAPSDETPGEGPQAVLADAVLRASGAREGYCVVYGAGGGRLVRRLIDASDLHVIAADADARKVSALRRRLDETGIYGTRASALAATVESLDLPAYLARLIVCREALPAGAGSGGSALRRISRSLHPYGGTACFALPAGQAKALAKRLAELELPGAEVTSTPLPGEGGTLVLLRRKGRLPGSADWTHQYADAANSVVSRDAIPRAPLGLLWFGGPANDEVLPRHGHGPSPQVAGGRLVIQGPDMLRAVDVYTGRLLWQTHLPDIGEFYDETEHQPGAGGIGSNYVTLADAIYVAYGRSALVLDPRTGKKVREFRLPQAPGSARPHWGYIAVADDVLLAGATPYMIRPRYKKDYAKRKYVVVGVDVAENARFARGSKRLVAMDRRTGRVLWTRPAGENFRHNAIAAGRGLVFCIDKISERRNDLLRRRGIEPSETARLLAMDLKTGKVVWQTQENVFGTWLGLSTQEDVLIQAGSRARDREPDEVGTGMVAYRGTTGEVLWRELKCRYRGPPMLWRDRIICQGPAFELLTGKPAMRSHPLTGEAVAWQFHRTYGCNTAIASRHLLTFRSGAAGYYDLLRDGGTGNFGGFKSGCTSNLIVADGVLSAPDYTRTCTCAYHNQCSLALVNMDDVETWTFSSCRYRGGRVRRLGLNFAAPGDRRDETGTLWLDWPSVGGPSPNVPVKTDPGKPRCYRHHSSRLRGEGLKWVAGSGLRGVRSIEIRLVKAKRGSTPHAEPYTVRLHFAEMDDSVRAGGRVFDVALQGRTVLKGFDIVRAAGGTRRAVVREFKGVAAADVLTVGFDPPEAAAISGIEIVQENRDER